MNPISASSVWPTQRPALGGLSMIDAGTPSSRASARTSLFARFRSGSTSTPPSPYLGGSSRSRSRCGSPCPRRGSSASWRRSRASLMRRRGLMFAVREPARPSSSGSVRAAEALGELACGSSPRDGRLARRRPARRTPAVRRASDRRQPELLGHPQRVGCVVRRRCGPARGTPTRVPGDRHLAQPRHDRRIDAAASPTTRPGRLATPPAP